MSKVKTVTGTAATVKVKVPGAGRITLSGSQVGKATRSAAKAGTYSVRVALTASAKRALAKNKKLTVKVKVAFQPSSGKAVSKTISVAFKQPKNTKAATQSALPNGANAKGGR